MTNLGKSLWAGLCVAAVFTLAEGCGQGTGGCKGVMASGPWQPFLNPYGDGGLNPALGVSGLVAACEVGGQTRVNLSVSHLPAGRPFGAHVHTLPCDAGAGGHYKNDPDGGTSAQNEVWLDFTTGSDGEGQAVAQQSWKVTPGAAHSVVIHDHGTSDAGTAGPKLTCVDVPF